LPWPHHLYFAPQKLQQSLEGLPIVVDKVNNHCKCVIQVHDIQRSKEIIHVM
jgi:hypothetical protein